jgi:hypothetical protein
MCTETRSIHFTKPTDYLHRSTGLVFVPVEHEGNVYESEEEVTAIAQIVKV